MRDYKVYIFFRWSYWLYKKLYKCSRNNEENKIIHSSIVKILKAIDFLFIVIPVIFCVNIHVKLEQHISNIVSEFCQLPVINTLFDSFSKHTFLFVGLGVFMFFFSRLYRSTYKVYGNEEKISSEFHYLLHTYRDFVNRIVLYKKEHGILAPDNDQIDYLYSQFFKDVCLSARQTMAEIINDKKCYIVVKLIEKKEGKLILNHRQAFPDLHPNDYRNKVELFNFTPVPTNLFQCILNKFNNIIGKGFDETTKNLSMVCNDLKGSKAFDISLNEDVLTRQRACIIIPITINYKIEGFFCFNTMRVGMLRKKHREMLSGYCDMVSNLLRNIITP